MTLAERLGLSVMHRLDPETAHGLAMHALRLGLVKADGPVTSPRLKQRLAGLELPNPVGLAAGFDKNAEVLGPLSEQGFGFLEVGAVTPVGQEGNPAPRLFRLSEDAAVINRFGFNNQGAEMIVPRLEARPHNIPVGLNLGANKDSEDRAADYVSVLTSCGPSVDFVTVNVSSPNTQNLRDLQGKAALWALLTRVLDARAKLERPLPVFLKIAPDLDEDALSDIAEVATKSSLDAIIATNTTVERPATLRSAHAAETGGLSGAPLFDPSTRILARLYEMTGGKVPLVGVGGIASAEDAYCKICAGASAVQLYSALVYQGMSLVTQIAHGLEDLLIADGFETVADAVGSDRGRWLTP